MNEVKRTQTVTMADIIDRNGNKVGEIEEDGNYTEGRMANIARKELNDPLASVRNVRKQRVVYYMDAERFFALADKRPAR